MIATVPFDFALNLCVGASFAIAGRARLPEEGLLTSTALLALVAFQVLVFAPIGAYFLLRYPDWSYMYLADAGWLSVPDPAVAVAYPVPALLSFFVARVLLLRGRLISAFGLSIAGLLLAGAVVAFGLKQLTLVGTTAAFRDGSTSLRPVWETRIPIVLGVAGPAIAAGWILSVARLGRLVRATRLREGQVAATRVRTLPPEEMPPVKIPVMSASKSTKKSGQRRSRK